MMQFARRHTSRAALQDRWVLAGEPAQEVGGLDAIMFQLVRADQAGETL
jgi:hypothetical protein